MRYRKRPVVIEAVQTIEPVHIGTLEGEMLANPGDWIITGVNGEKYPCKPDIFEKTYEPFTNDTPAVFTAADLAAAEERGRREALESIRRNSTYDESAAKTKTGWRVGSRTYSIDADVFDALLGAKEAGDGR